MNLIKTLFGKTLTRIVTGDPGNLQEFFEMVREKGEKEVIGVLNKRQNTTNPDLAYGVPPLCILSMDYHSKSLKFSDGLIVGNDYINCENSRRKSLIENLERYSPLFPDIQVKLCTNLCDNLY